MQKKKSLLNLQKVVCAIQKIRTVLESRLCPQIESAWKTKHFKFIGNFTPPCWLVTPFFSTQD